MDRFPTFASEQVMDQRVQVGWIIHCIIVACALIHCLSASQDGFNINADKGSNQKGLWAKGRVVIGDVG